MAPACRLASRPSRDTTNTASLQSGPGSAHRAPPPLHPLAPAGEAERSPCNSNALGVCHRPSFGVAGVRGIIPEGPRPGSPLQLPVAGGSATRHPTTTAGTLAARTGSTLAQAVPTGGCRRPCRPRVARGQAPARLPCEHPHAHGIAGARVLQTCACPAHTRRHVDPPPKDDDVRLPDANWAATAGDGSYKGRDVRFVRPNPHIL